MSEQVTEPQVEQNSEVEQEEQHHYFGFYPGEKELGEKINSHVREQLEAKKEVDFNVVGKEILEFLNRDKESIRELIFDSVRKNLADTHIPFIVPNGDYHKMITDRTGIDNYINENLLKPDMWHVTNFKEDVLSSGREVYKIVYDVSQEGNAIQATIYFGRPNKKTLRAFIKYNMIE